MLVDIYFNTDVEYEEYLGNNNKTMYDEYANKINIKCRIEDKQRFIRNLENYVSLSEQTYLTTYPVKVKDRLNGQYITSVKIIYSFEGDIIYREASV